MRNIKGLLRKKVFRIEEVILFFFKAQVAANSRASISKTCNAEKGRKNKSKYIGYFVTNPKWLLIVLVYLSGCSVKQDWENIGGLNDGKYVFINDNVPDKWNQFGFDDSAWKNGKINKEYFQNKNVLLFRHAFEIKDLKKIKLFLLQIPKHTQFKLYINEKLVYIQSENYIGHYNSNYYFKDSIPVVPEKSLNNLFFKQNVLPLQDGKNLIALELRKDKFSEDFSQISFFLNKHLSSVAVENIPNYNPVSYFHKSLLPLVTINTCNNPINKEIKSTAEMFIKMPNNNEKKNKREISYMGNINIKLRGNTSLSYPKKSYSIETVKKNGKNKNVSLFGFSKDEDWVLYGPYADKTLIRNSFVFKLSKMIGKYAPQTKFVELIINNDYQGVYLIMEKINRKRLNISKADSSDISGGYIIAIDKACQSGWASKIKYCDTCVRTFFCYKYPKYDKITDEQKQYIQNYFDEFEHCLYNHKSMNNLIDINSFIDYFILNELARNIDAYRLSTYLYKPKNDKLYIGPIWDFNYSFGYNNSLDATNPEGWVYETLPKYVPFWWELFMKDSVFVSKLKMRWNSLRENELSDENLLKMMDEEVNKLGDAKERNFQRWPILDDKLWMEENEYSQYNEYVNAMKAWTLKRAQWMDETIN